MTTRDIPTVDVSLSRAKRRPSRDAVATASVATAPANPASAHEAGNGTRRRLFRPFRFSGADVALSVDEIESDLRYGRD